MIDLDKVLVYIAEAKGYLDDDSDPDSYIAAALQDAEEMVAELRAARKVMGPASAIYEDGNYDPVFFAELGDALDAYDKVTGEAR